MQDCNYRNNEAQTAAQYAQGAILGGGALSGAGTTCKISVPTIGDSIESKLKREREEIAELEKIRATLDKANMLDMPIAEIASLLRY